jgi:glutamine---fructose-6-phosphate transaminase (isomerizing)
VDLAYQPTINLSTCNPFEVSVLAREAAEIPAAAGRQLANTDAIAEVVRRLRDRPPRFVVTCARGSSDHACTYGKYLIETTIGLPVASVGPSIASTYGRVPKLDGALFVAVSQSGRSPDLIELTTAARKSGAIVLGIINDTASPLAATCDVVIPQHAGEETAVAATKSFVCSCLAFLQLVASWRAIDAVRGADGSANDPAAPIAIGRITELDLAVPGNVTRVAREAAARFAIIDRVATAADDAVEESAMLRRAVDTAPSALAAAAALDWSSAFAALANVTNLYVLGRGVGLAVAQELALKLKEVCGLHAEAFSTAELKHGPLALARPGFPVIALAQTDRTEPSVRETVAQLVGLGCDVASTLPADGARLLPTVPDVPAVLAPLCQVLAAYLALPGLARARGFDPDRPPHLAKITRTR